MSDFINDNLTVIRISISCLFAGSLLLNVAKSTHYKQLNASNSLHFINSSLYGQIHQNKDGPLFIHLPLWKRLFLGRKRLLNDQTGFVQILMPINYHSLSPTHTQILFNRNLKFKILSVHPDSNLPIGIPLVRLKWYHPFKTNIIRYWIKNGCTKVSEPWNITELPNCHSVEMELQVLKELESKKKNRWRWLKSFLNR